MSLGSELRELNFDGNFLVSGFKVRDVDLGKAGCGDWGFAEGLENVFYFCA
jgi:hypothetical protein